MESEIYNLKRDGEIIAVIALRATHISRVKSGFVLKDSSETVFTEISAKSEIEFEKVALEF